MESGQAAPDKCHIKGGQSHSLCFQLVTDDTDIGANERRDNGSEMQEEVVLLLFHSAEWNCP